VIADTADATSHLLKRKSLGRAQRNQHPHRLGKKAYNNALNAPVIRKRSPTPQGGSLAKAEVPIFCTILFRTSLQARARLLHHITTGASFEGIMNCDARKQRLS
jgi:hypothetical protein